MKKVVLISLAVILLAALVYSYLVPQYVDRGRLWAKYPNRRCRCYGLHFVGMTTYIPGRDPNYITPELCLGVQARCEALTESGWNQDAYTQVTQEEKLLK